MDEAGNAWFTQPGDVDAPGTSNIGRIDAVTGAVTTTPTTDGSITVAPRSITVASDGQVWFTARFTPPCGRAPQCAQQLGDAVPR